MSEFGKMEKETSKPLAKGEMPVGTKSGFRRIMVITDFSDNARRVYAYATSLVKQTGATLFLVHFGNKKAPEYSGVSNEEHVRRLYKALTKESRIDVFTDLPVKTFLLERRDIAKSLRSFEQEMYPELVISSTFAKAGFGRHFVFEVADKIISSSSVPVLLFGPAADEYDGALLPKLALVPFDFSDEAVGAIPTLQFLGASYNCALRLLFIQKIVPDRISWLQRIWSEKPHSNEAVEQRFADLVADELDGCDVKWEICQAVPEVEIGSRARNTKADLVVIGARSALGRVSQTVIRLSHCPVLAVPSKTHRE